MSTAFLRGLSTPVCSPSAFPLRVPAFVKFDRAGSGFPPPTFHPPRSMATSAISTSDASTPPEPNESDPIVQYVVLRRDLIEQWPLGSVVAQGCHASVAAIWSHRDHPDTAAYCSLSNLDSMRKVTLEVKGEEQMRNLSEKLTAGDIGHKMWIEQPENMPTCIATRPRRRSEMAPFFKKLKLCK